MKDFIAFFGEFIVVIAVSGMFHAMTPEGSQKKYIHFAISVCVLSSMMGPMLSVVSSLPETLEQIQFDVENDQIEMENTLTEAVIQASKEQIECSIVDLLSQKYDVDKEKISVSVSLNTEDPEQIELIAIEVRIADASFAKREEIRRYLSDQFLGEPTITVSD